MAETLVNHAFAYAGYALEAALLVCLLQRRRARRWVDVFLYVLLLLLIDGVGRWVVFYTYGLHSKRYYYFYWLTDVLLALAAFLLVCSFFRRTFARTHKARSYLRLILPFVFVLVAGISWYSISHHYTDLYSRFIFQFQQNLYFACLVLTTVLYVMLQGFETAEDEFHLLVCGLGLQFAGPAANMALIWLTPGHGYAGSVLVYLAPCCTLAMLSLWLYAVARVPRTVTRVSGGEQALQVPVLAWNIRIE